MVIKLADIFLVLSIKRLVGGILALLVNKNINKCHSRTTIEKSICK